MGAIIVRKPHRERPALIKHLTSSMFVFHRDHGVWRTGLIHHPFLKAWIQPGGHVDPDENPAQAAAREAREETGLHDIEPVSLIGELEHHDGIAHMPMPAWIVEHEIGGDNHVAEPHIHVDFKYVGITRSGQQRTTPDHPFRWFDRGELKSAETLDDIRALTSTLFDFLESDSPG